MKFLLAVVLAALFGVSGAKAQPYPARPITMIVPFPAGGVTDIVARIVSDRMKTSLGQTVIAENVAGAGGTIGVTRLFRSPPDGHTIAIGQWTSHVGAGAMYSLPYRLPEGLRADIDAVNRSALDHRAEQLPCQGHEGADRLAEGASGQGDGRHDRRRQRHSHVHGLFRQQDQYADAIRAVSRCGAGDAGSAGRSDRPVVSGGGPDARAISRRRD